MGTVCVLLQSKGSPSWSPAAFRSNIQGIHECTTAQINCRWAPKAGQDTAGKNTSVQCTFP